MFIYDLKYPLDEWSKVETIPFLTCETEIIIFFIFLERRRDSNSGPGKGIQNEIMKRPLYLCAISPLVPLAQWIWHKNCSIARFVIACFDRYCFLSLNTQKREKTKGEKPFWPSEKEPRIGYLKRDYKSIHSKWMLKLFITW